MQLISMLTCLYRSCFKGNALKTERVYQQSHMPGDQVFQKSLGYSRLKVNYLFDRFYTVCYAIFIK